MRSAIMEATKSVLSDMGWDGTTMERIAARAGISKGTIYNYFKDKTELMGSLRKELAEPYISALNDISVGRGAPEERLERVIRAAMDELFRNIKLIRAIIIGQMLNRSFNIESLRDPCMTQHRMHRILASLIKEGISSGSMTPVDPDAAAALIQGGIFEVMRRIAIFEGPLDREGIVGTFRSVVFGGILKQGEME